MRYFYIFVIFLTLSGCAHLQADRFPEGLGTHPSSAVSIPSHIGAGIGALGGIPLSLALAPITLPAGYLYNESGGAFAFLVYPTLVLSYGIGAIFGAIPYFISLAFSPPPLQDPSPARRFRAIQAVAENRDFSSLPRLFEILERDVPENRQEAAQTLGKIGDDRAIERLLTIYKKTKDLYLKYYCYQALVKIAVPQNQAFWLSLSKSRDMEEVKIALLILGKLKTRAALLRLIEMLDTSYVFWAHKVLQKVTEKQIPPDPDKWRIWLDSKKSYQKKS